jgi:hypothetical protein
MRDTMGARGIVGESGDEIKGRLPFSGEPKVSPTALSSRRRIGYTLIHPTGGRAMPNTATRTPVASRVAIFGRVFEGKKGMSQALARELVKLEFSEEDHARMHELAVKNSAGTITPAEFAELGYFVDVTNLLTSLQSRARMALKASHQRAATRG